jgi:hypothetical protein
MPLLKRFIGTVEEIGGGARLGRLIEAMLAHFWIREHMEARSDALLEWADGGAQQPGWPPERDAHGVSK